MGYQRLVEKIRVYFGDEGDGDQGDGPFYQKITREYAEMLSRVHTELSKKEKEANERPDEDEQKSDVNPYK